MNLAVMVAIAQHLAHSGELMERCSDCRLFGQQVARAEA